MYWPRAGDLLWYRCRSRRALENVSSEPGVRTVFQQDDASWIVSARRQRGTTGGGRRQDPVGQYVKRGLEEHVQYIADWVTDGVEALHAWQPSIPYDLIILDLRLPGMTGIEVLRTLRDRGQTLPVLVLTAQDSVEFKVDALRATRG